jgi:hypothetical protein
MKSNMKLKITSELGRESSGAIVFSGTRQPFGSIKKNVKVLGAISPRIVGTTLRKSAQWVLIITSGYRAGTCASRLLKKGARRRPAAVIHWLR